MRFYTSDWHLDHKKILQYVRQPRPAATVEEMNDKLIDIMNRKVQPNDELWILGDVAFCDSNSIRNYFRRIHCKNVHLVLGNHDKTIRKDIGLQLEIFRSVQDYKEIKSGDNHFVLSHFAFRVWNKSHHGSYNLYGHSHGDLPGIGRQMDVGVDTRPDMSPWSEQEILQKLSKEPFGVHHGD